MDASSSPLYVQIHTDDIVADIQKAALETCADDGIKIKHYYEAVLWQCYHLCDVDASPDELRSKVESTLQNFEGDEPHIWATNIARIMARNVSAYRLSLDELLPSKPKLPHEIKQGLPLQSIKKPRSWDDWSSDEENEVPLQPKKVEVLNTTSVSSASSVVCQTVSMPLVNQQGQTATHEEVCHNWLKEMDNLLDNFHVALLRRYIPRLSRSSLQQIVDVCSQEFNAYCHEYKVQRVSKMAMRKILETTFAKVAPKVPDIRDLQEQWLATADKPNRKSKNSTQAHMTRWRQS